jgi:hypothetical protein
MKNSNLKRAAAVLGCVASLAGPAALAPAGAAAAPKAMSCGARSIKVPVKGGKAVTTPVSLIRVEGGATCAEATAVIRGVLTKELPKGWKVTKGNFKVPHGLTPQVAVNGHKKVTFALPGYGA